MVVAMTIVPLGDSALLLRLGQVADAATLARVQMLAADLVAARLPGVRDIVPAYTTIGVFFETETLEPDVLSVGRARVEALAAKKRTKAGAKGELKIVPVCYGGEAGPDLEEVAGRAGLAAEEVIRRHAEVIYRVAAVGFAPGFAYLAGLPEELQMARRETPRVRVPAGSVGIGGGQTGIYPTVSPGGWNLIGRTPRRLFDPGARPPAWLQAGDRVKFERITAEELAGQEAEASRGGPTGRTPAGDVEVLRPGVLTTVQDLGRWGWQAQGVSPGGAMDEGAARLANLVVGNPEGAAVLETSLRGPVLRFGREAAVALTGARVKGVAGGRILRVEAGGTLDLGDIEAGARAYVAVAGGWAVAEVLDGKGTDLLGGFGGWKGRALRAGDRLAIGAGAELLKTGGWFVPGGEVWPTDGVMVVRAVRGAQWDCFRPATRRGFFGAEFGVTGKSNRMGLRLSAFKVGVDDQREMVSEAVAAGAVQVPPDGAPIVLGVDRQTLGGYPKIANVITADLPRLAQLPPGARVRFAEVSQSEAQAARLKAVVERGKLRSGLAWRR